MRIIADLHIHSRFARATSKELTIPNVAEWAKIKGLNLMGTGDFTHPAWFNEMKENFVLSPSGFYHLKEDKTPIYFVPTAEVASIYTQGNKLRRIHLVIIAPTLEAVKKINTKLADLGVNLYSDGRPITGIPAKILVKIILEIEPKSLIIPAHIWTPWFAILGSKSGFDSVEECFEEMTPYIFALETGLSSDPEMNWRLAALDKYTLISNSDAHSLGNLGREANVFELPDDEFTYDNFWKIIKTKDRNRFKYTVEFYPEEGMYHFDGHRNCKGGTTFPPEESKKLNNICPVCNRELTIGVMHRVADLADRPTGFIPDKAIPARKLIPLDEIIAQAIQKNTGTKAVQNEYQNFINLFGPEYPALLDVNLEKIRKSHPQIAEGIFRVRTGKLTIKPGYDGTYGKVEIFGNDALPANQQQALF